ncbi:hypothetical protein VTO42DRAFT_1426 [Malbranchea cinnamomea]
MAIVESTCHETSALGLWMALTRLARLSLHLAALPHCCASVKYSVCGVDRMPSGCLIFTSTTSQPHSHAPSDYNFLKKQKIKIKKKIKLFQDAFVGFHKTHFLKGFLHSACFALLFFCLVWTLVGATLEKCRSILGKAGIDVLIPRREACLGNHFSQNEFDELSHHVIRP